MLAIWLVLTLWPGDAGAEPSAAAFEDLAGRWRLLEPTYDDLVAPRGPPRPWLAAGENLGWLTLGTIYYWTNPELNRRDWDRDSLADRFDRDIVRFDNNDTLTNHVVHPFMGGAFYSFARVNNLDQLTSAAFAFGTSFVWEFAFEWREVVSINDQVFTGLGGIPMGEFFFQMGEYVTSARDPTWAGELGAWTFGLPRNVHMRAFDDAAPEPMPRDNLGLSSAYGHRFHLAPHLSTISGSEAGSLSEQLYGLRAEGELVSLPGFQRPGDFGMTFAHGNFTQGRVEVDSNERQALDLDLWFMADHVGRYWQDYAGTGRPREVSGRAGLVALSTAFRYLDRRLDQRSDQLAVAHLAGPALTLWGRRGPWRGRLDVNAHLDFAAIRSLAFEEWRDDQDEATVSEVKTVLVEKSYQFHLGGSGRGRASLAYDLVELGARGAYGRYGSLEGLDRREERLGRDLHGLEEVWEWGGWLAVEIPHTPLEARLSFDALGRDSRIADAVVRRWDLRNRLSLGAVF